MSDELGVMNSAEKVFFPSNHSAFLTHHSQLIIISDVFRQKPSACDDLLHGVLPILYGHSSSSYECESRACWHAYGGKVEKSFSFYLHLLCHRLLKKWGKSRS